MNYTVIFQDAFNTFWKHKALWVFGILIALTGQGDYNFSVNYQERYNLPVQDGAPDLESIPGSEMLLAFFDNPIPYLVGFALISLAVWVVGALIAWGAQGALIGMVDQADRTGATSVRDGWPFMKERAVPLTLLSILFNLPAILMFIPLYAAMIWLFLQFADFYRSMLTGGPLPEREIEQVFGNAMPSVFSIFLCAIPVICFVAVLTWALGLIHMLSARGMVLENLGVMESVRRGWQVARANLGVVLLNWFLLFLLRVGFNFVAAIPALIVWVPVARALLHGDWNGASIAGVMFFGLYMLVVVVGVGGILMSFNSALWTKLYKAAAANEPARHSVVETAAS